MMHHHSVRPLPDQVVGIEGRATTHHRLVLWLHQKLKDKPQTFDDLFPQFLKEISGWDKHEGSPDLADLLTDNFFCYVLRRNGRCPGADCQEAGPCKARAFWYVHGAKPS